MLLSTAAPISGETDEALLERIGRRDDAALRELHRRYAPLVFTVAARVVGAAAAEEVVQDVFVAVWTKHESFDPARGRLRPWLVQIARRRALNGLRKSKREPHGDERAVDGVEGDDLAPDEAGWLAHRQAIVRAAVDALPEAQRRALSLAFFDELTHEQIASVLRTPVGTTKTRIRLALKRLAPVLFVAVAGAVVLFVVRRRDERGARTEDALRMVTASDVVPLHLAAAAGAQIGRASCRERV